MQGHKDRRLGFNQWHIFESDTRMHTFTSVRASCPAEESINLSQTSLVPFLWSQHRPLYTIKRKICQRLPICLKHVPYEILK